MPAIRTRPSPIDVSTAHSLVAPSVAIVSPTPRAFTFSSSSAVAPSARMSSPFDGLKPLTIPALPVPGPCTPSPESPISDCSSLLSSPVRPRTPADDVSSAAVLTRSPSPMRASTPTPSSSKGPTAPAVQRRQSVSDAAAGGVVRRPKKGDEDYIKRPENAFILFRRKCVEERVQAQEAEAAAASEEQVAETNANGKAPKVKKARQADLSKMISQQWRGLSTEERTYWENLAKEKKREHELLHPDYVYRPQRTKKAATVPSKTASKKGKGRAEPEPESATQESVSFVLPLPASPTSPTGNGRGHVRSSSAPGSARFAPPAPTSQMIRLPVVQMPPMPISPVEEVMLARRYSSFDGQVWPAQQPAFDPSFQPQVGFEAPVFTQPFWDSNGVPSLYMPPVEGSLFPSGPSPIEVSPVSAFPQAWTAEASDAALVPFDMDVDMSGAAPSSLPELCDMPWTHEFVGEFVPLGLLSDGDFDLAAIAPATLDDLCEQKGGAWDLSALDLGSAVVAPAQDSLDFYLHDATAAATAATSPSGGAGRF